MVKSLSAKPTKWSNTLKQLSVLDHFVGLALKELIIAYTKLKFTISQAKFLNVLIAVLILVIIINVIIAVLVLLYIVTIYRSSH